MNFLDIFYTIFFILVLVGIIGGIVEMINQNKNKKRYLNTQNNGSEIKKIEDVKIDYKQFLEKFEPDLIEFLKPYSKVAIETIRIHFSRHYSDTNFEFYKAYQKIILFSYSSPPMLIKILEDLIKRGRIKGYIRPFGNKYYYVSPEQTSPSLAYINVGDKYDIRTGDIAINIGYNYCPNCGYKVEKEWKSCPKCDISLKKDMKGKIYCTNCGKKIQVDWRTCPYCTTKI